MKNILLDIMLGERFIKQLIYSFNPLFPIDYEDLTAFVEKNCPQVKGKDYRIEFSKQKI